MENSFTTLDMPIDSMEELLSVFGVFDENLKVIEEETHTHIHSTENGISISGSEADCQLVATVLEKLLQMQQKGEPLNRSRIRYAIELAKEGNAELISQIMGDTIALTARGKQVKCKTLGQKRYVQALKDYDLVFGVGPAGTGKTYLAVAMAVLAYKNK